MSDNYKIVNIAPLTKIPLTRRQLFSYKIDKNISTCSGQLVNIPFSGRILPGVIIQDKKYIKSEEKLDPKRLKKIIKVEDQELSLTPHQLKIAFWMSEQYISPLGLCLKQMTIKKIKISRNNILKKITANKNHGANILNDEQQKATENIRTAIKKQSKINDTKKRIFLLHGVTGSGKTEVYMDIIKRVIAQGKQTILLIPEIALTPQTVMRFNLRFGADTVAIIHSRLTAGEKYQYWLNIKNKRAKIIIGPRSAIFAPVKDLGLIVIDEEHDSSYKQYDQGPRYHARDIALKISELAQIPVILGSATPSIESYYKAVKNKYTLLTLKKRFKYGLNLPPVKIVDMRNEFKKRNYSIFSEVLMEQISKVYEKNKQALIFVNRRGMSTFVMCRDCGFVVECPNCSVSLTYHAGHNKQIMVCHHCSYKENVKTVCPKCDSKYIKYFGTGTQRVEQELKQLLPKANILRMDKDTMNKKDIHFIAFDAFSKKKYDILIGTQMITKGLDLSNIELVGIITADALFNFPDFRTNERAFQAITQVSGRTSRSKNTGNVILQTYNIDNFVIKCAAEHDYKKYYKAEIKIRKELGYPPYLKLIKIIFEGINYKALGCLADNVVRDIKLNISNINIIGPSPAYIIRKRNKYIWNCIIKYKNENNLEEIYKFIPQNCKIDVNPEDLL